MKFLLGLTGSIGMGKSTTAALFSARGCAIWDADKIVHEAYSAGGLAVIQMSKIHPEVVKSGTVDRKKLKEIVLENPKKLAQIESIIHPLVKRDRENFIETNTSKILVFDIPLLFELGTQTKFDAVACVTISSKIQEERVLSRSGMTKKHLDVIISKQLSSAEKVARSDYVIDTTSMKSAELCVENILRDIEERQKNA